MTDDSVAVGHPAERAGWTVIRLERWRDAEALNATDLVVYGEHMFAEYISYLHEVKRVQPPFEFLATVPYAYRKREVQFTTLAQARQLSVPAFIKPADDKCFAACVYESGSQLPDLSILPAATPVLISEPVTWGIEFRCFVLDREVQTLSPYSRDGELVEDEQGRWPATPKETAEALAFARSVLADPIVSFPIAGVLDVGVIRDRGSAVIESNPARGAGIYGADPDRALRVIAYSCRVRP